MARAAKAIIHLEAIKANYRLAKSHAPSAKAVAVVKADAYGHGAQRVAAEAGWAEGAGRLIGALPTMIGEGQIDAAAVKSGATPPVLAALIAEIATTGLQKLAASRSNRQSIPRACRAPLLSLKSAERRLKAVLRPDANIFLDDGAVSPFRDRLSLFSRALTGRY